MNCYLYCVTKVIFVNNKSRITFKREKTHVDGYIKEVKNRNNRQVDETSLSFLCLCVKKGCKTVFSF